jgi:RNA polymerase sigma factor (sigma-70 family)
MTSPHDDSSYPVSEQDWEKVGRRLVSYFAHRYIRDAQDAAQETLARMAEWLKHNQPRGNDGFMMMVWGIAKNVLHEYIRAGRCVPEELNPGIAIPANSTLGLNSLETRQLLEQLFKDLPEKDGLLILASQDVPPAELARRLEISLRTLRVRLHRAKKRLRKLIDGKKKGVKRNTPGSSNINKQG